jgi:hypothetical protein
MQYRYFLTLACVLALLVGLSVTQSTPQAAQAAAPTLVVLPDAGPGATATLAPWSTDQAGQLTITTTSTLQDPVPVVEVHVGTTHRTVAVLTPADPDTADPRTGSLGVWTVSAAGYFTVGIVAPRGLVYTYTYLTHTF